MKTKIVLIGLIGIVAVLLFAFFKGYSPILAEKQKPSSAYTAKACPSKVSSYTIQIKDQKFSPDMITVKKCDSVTFENEDENSDYLPAFGEHPDHTNYPGFTEKLLKFGDKNTFTATVAGAFHFHDHIQDEAEGHLIVKEN